MHQPWLLLRSRLLHQPTKSIAAATCEDKPKVICSGVRCQVTEGGGCRSGLGWAANNGMAERGAGRPRAEAQDFSFMREQQG
jgi:hypothetical protein